MKPLDENQIAELTGRNKLHAQVSLLEDLGKTQLELDELKKRFIELEQLRATQIAECVAFEINYTVIGDRIGVSRQRAYQLYRESGLWRKGWLLFR